MEGTRSGLPLLGASARPRAGVLLVGCAVLVAVLGLVFARQNTADRFDHAVDSPVIAWFASHHALALWLAFPGSMIPAVVLTAALTIGCLLTGRRRGAVLAILAVPVTAVITDWLRAGPGDQPVPAARVVQPAGTGARWMTPVAKRARYLFLILATGYRHSVAVRAQTRGAMARIGSLAAWEQRLAAQRRDEDRLARERRQREKDTERLRQQEHLAERQQAAEEQTAEVEERMKALGEVLTSVLPLRPLTFERLLVTRREPGFDPGPLGSALPAPDWDDFAPVPAAGLGRLLGPGARRARVTEARVRFEAAQAEHQRQEAERRRALAVAKAKYDRKVTEERATAAARNAYVISRQSAFAAGDPEAVEWFIGCVLRVSRYPDGIPREYEVTCDPGNRDVTVDLELPPRGVVPATRAYRYVKARDAVEPVPRQDSEITQAHERLVACVALRALHEIFGATPAELVQAVALTGWVRSVDRATGSPVRPRLLTVRAERTVFGTLVLDAVDPVACVDRLSTLSPA